MAVAVAKFDVLGTPLKTKRRDMRMDEVQKAIKSCLKTVEVAQNQLNKDLISQLENHYHLKLEAYESQSSKFLKIPQTKDLDVWFLVEHLKKYCVTIKQMMKENADNIKYHESLNGTSHQILQLMEILKLTGMLMTGKNASKKGFPTLPDDMKTEGSRSKRQNRDFLFVKEYKTLLKTMEDVLKKY